MKIKKVIDYILIGMFSMIMLAMSGVMFISIFLKAQEVFSFGMFLSSLYALLMAVIALTMCIMLSVAIWLFFMYLIEKPKMNFREWMCNKQ